MTEVPPLKIHVLTSPDQVSEFWAWLTAPGRRMVAVDTETTGLDWWSPYFKVRLIQFGDALSGWAIPFEGWPSLVAGALAWCSTARVRMVFHNVAYDSLALRAMGIELDWSVVDDTFVYAHLGGYAEQARTLKGCAQREFGGWAGAGERLLKSGMANGGWDWASVPIGWKPYPIYGVVDTCITAGLWELWDDRRARWGSDHDLEIASIRLTGDMAWRGVPTDGVYLAEQINLHEEQLEKITAELASFGVTNPTQNGQLENVLTSAGFDLSARTAKGKVQLDDDVLKMIDHPAARLTQKHRQVSRWLSAYLQPIFTGSGSVLGPGLLHPDIRSMEAATGRMSVARPALQQLPAEDPTVRRAIVPRTEGEVVVSSDFGQIELRLWAMIMRDLPMIQALKTADATNGDFFVELGKTIYQDPDFVKKDSRRGLLKATTYTKLFGGGLEKAAGGVGVGPYELAPTWKAMEKAYPSLETLGSELIETRRSPDGELEYVVTSPLYGREFRVKDYNERRKLGNYVCQGTAAIVLKKALVGLDAAGFGDAMVLPVHDEVVFSLPETEAADAMREIAQVMDAIVTEEQYGLAVRAEPSMGRNWAEAKG